jgi:hypothetical protein
MNQNYLHRMGRCAAGPAETLDDALAALAPMIIGVRRQTVPPVFRGSERLHRMHVLVMNPFSAFQAPANELEEILPRLTRWPAEPQARPVLGEILRGERGEWYECVGRRIRPLRQLVAGPDGEVLEVPTAPVAAHAPGVARQRMAEPPLHDQREADDSTESPTDSVAPSNASREIISPPFRKLLADPGVWRVVTLGAFKPILASQLAQPARLRDLHRLPCHVQVFEATAPQLIETLARMILGDQAGPVELQPLTPAVVAQLGLAPFLPAPANVPPFTPGRGAVGPGQRFFRLTVASDPTANPPQPQSVPRVSPSPAVATPNGKVPVPPTAPSARKTEIPALLLRPWEFRHTRDETIAGLRRANSWVARLTRPLRRLCYHAEFRKWQLLLSGRSAEEQLWGVPPPRGWLGDPWLRDWARHTLELGGYDSNVLLAEWEVFWGRKVT